MSSSKTLIFLENRREALHIARHLQLDAQTKLIAVTAEAAEALEAQDLPHEPVCAYADTRVLVSADERLNQDCFALAEEIEGFIGQRYTGAKFDGPGFLSGQGYFLQYSASAIQTRAFLMRETIRACSPEKVVVFAGEIDPWFVGDGYPRNPWLIVAGQLAQEHGFTLEVLECSSDARSVLENFRTSVDRLSRTIGRKAWNNIRPFFPSPSFLDIADERDLNGLRLLMVDTHSYDWAPVLNDLRKVKGVDVFRVHRRFLDARTWTFHFDSSLEGLEGRGHAELGVQLSRPDKDEVREISDLFDVWLRQRPADPGLTALGFNLLPALVPHLKAMATLGPALTRHSDMVAQRALDAIKPHAVCFFSIPWVATKRLAFQCRLRRIPTVCYQHGGAYGTHILTQHEQIELGHADYFLTYGTGIQSRVNPAFPVRARYVPVGSARIAAMTAQPRLSSPRSHRAISVLWIGEISLRNTVGGPFLVEDTQRYLMQKECLQLLGRADKLCVTYRSYPGREQWNAAGTTRWLARTNLPSIRMSAWLPLEKLIRQHDLVITDCSSNTAWNEVLALERPLIVYCDPEQTPLTAAYMTDLEAACFWCKTGEALVVAVRKLALEGETFLADLRKKESSTYLRKYVVHERPDASVTRVVSFLNSVCRRKRPVEDWESETHDNAT
jgi:hypothetical protein